MSASLWQHWGREGTAAWGSRGSGIYSPCGEKAEPCSWAASLGDAKSQPRLFTTVFLSWFLALVSSVTTLWSASQEPELSFQLAGTLELCCILLSVSQAYSAAPRLSFIHTAEGFPNTFPACPRAQ